MKGTCATCGISYTDLTTKCFDITMRAHSQEQPPPDAYGLYPFFIPRIQGCSHCTFRWRPHHTADKEADDTNDVRAAIIDLILGHEVQAVHDRVAAQEAALAGWLH